MYILPPSISKKIEGYRWQSFTPPAAGKSRRFRGLICHRRSQLIALTVSDAEEICTKLNRRLGLDYEAWTALAAKSMRAGEHDPDGDAWH